MKIAIVLGTRPEIIKMASVMDEIQNKGHELLLIHTGQHYDKEMSENFFLDLKLPKPNYNIHVGSGSHGKQTGKMMEGIEEVLLDEKPDIVLVHGDTTTSTASALAAFYQQIPVGHIEAGLRTHNIYSPWPEEMNRLITGRITTHHFSPTPLAKENLLREHVDEKQIIVTGNTVIDALQMVVKRLAEDKALANKVATKIDQMGYDVQRLEGNRRMVLITGHRRENFGEGFLNICHAIKHLAEQYPEVDFVYPMHLNPNVRKPVLEILGEGAENVFLIEPLDYLPFVYMMQHSTLILTDSGGVQEEAPGLGKPVLVMRDTTERPEAVEAGTVLLVGTNREKIEHGVSMLLDDADTYRRMSEAVNPYGDGHACERIVNKLSE